MVTRADREDPYSAELRRTAFGIITAFFLADGLLRTFYEYFGGQAVGASRSFADSFGSEITGALATAIVFFMVVVPTSRRWPVRGSRWARHLPVHASALVVYSVVKTLLMWGFRLPLWPVLGLGHYDYGNLLFRFPMEGAGDVLGYAFLTAAVHAWDGWQRSKEREVRTARLESQLTSARLNVLSDQLQPHFLFNTLNTIGSLVHDNPEAADRMITRLSDLLRRALESPPDELVTVREEIAFVQEYVDIMSARFGDRARVAVHVDGDVSDALLPPFVVQPLVENAFKYGVEPQATRGTVSITVGSRGAELHVQVQDDGPGLASSRVPTGSGLGLANVRDRLSLLFGQRGSLTLVDHPESGVVATIRMPLAFRAQDEPPAGARAG